MQRTANPQASNGLDLPCRVHRTCVLAALFTLALPILTFAQNLTPEQCAAQLQKATVTVRIRLEPPAAKEVPVDDETKDATQVTVCSGVAVGEKLVVTAAFAAAD